MSIFKCKMCGGDLNVTGSEKVVECEYCGSRQTVPSADDEKKVNLFNRANRLRIACDFDRAAAIYEQIIADFPEEAEAYWGLCLSNYGIEYVDDPATGKKIPTCHRASFDKMRKDENYAFALDNADISSRMVYEEQAKEIDRIMGEILSVSRDEEPYDIFICYKETDNNGSRTPDSVLAQDIYDALVGKGYRVFFSRITLEDKLGAQYEPYIFSALNSAKIMLAVGTDFEYFNAVWVKNEWSRFLKLMAKDKAKVLIPCYQNMDPYDMPDEFKGLQSQDCSKLGFMQDLIRGIKKILSDDMTKATTNETVIFNQGFSSTTPLLKRAFMFLEDGQWKEADEYCEKVLDQDPENALAYLGKLMTELKVHKKEDLNNLEEPFDENGNYAKALRFADEALSSDLKGYITHIKQRNENARLTGIYNGAVNAMNAAKTVKAFKAAADMFAAIPGFKDTDTLAQECIEKAKELKAEAENIYQQLVDALQNEGNVETMQTRLEAAIQKKNSLATTFEEMLSHLEKDKEEITDKTAELNKIQQKLQSLDFERCRIDNNISSAEKQFSSLGMLAFSQKKELSQKIEQLNSESCRLKDEIEDYQRKAGVLRAVLAKMGSISELELNAKKEQNNILTKQHAVDEEISQLQTRLAEEQEKGEKKLTLPEIVKEVTKKEHISSFIRDNPQKLKAISVFENLPPILCLLFDYPFFFGRYPQGENGEIAPIEWTVLAKENGKALVISKYALDCKQYNTTDTKVTWESCSLRKWMNETFLNAVFTSEEQAQILDSYVSADENPEYSTDPGNATTDKVFLLSINEVKKYFNGDEERKCAPTAYAEANGVRANNRYKTASGEATCWWWLRSPGASQKFAALVNYDVSVSYFGSSVNYAHDCVRPALWINLDS